MRDEINYSGADADQMQRPSVNPTIAPAMIAVRQNAERARRDHKTEQADAAEPYPQT